MNKLLPQTSIDSVSDSFATLMKRLRIGRLGETFLVRDVMVQRSQIEYVTPGDLDAANRIVLEKRFSVVPASYDGYKFESVFCTEHPTNGARNNRGRATDIR